MEMKKCKICTKCVSDTTIKDIVFDDQGVCNFCRLHDIFETTHPLNEVGEENLEKLITQIKKRGKNQTYDCIVGVSGGRDSTYLLYVAKKFELRPLAVHVDNGWNNEIAVSNIKTATEILGIDLYTVVLDWEEFKDLQRAFLKASINDADANFDYVADSVLFRTAYKENIRYILNGHSFRTEGNNSKTWTYIDPRYLKDVYKKFGDNKIKTLPIMSLFEFLYYVFIKKIKEIRLLEYIEYDQKKVSGLIKSELNWKYYGGHHHDNTYTHFFQSYYLPLKFNIDKRKNEFSALIRSGQITREQALEELKSPYPIDHEIVKYAITKLDFTEGEFEEIMNAPNKSFHDFKNFLGLIKALKLPIKIAAKGNLVPKILYEKYAK
jgi:N-acetyl sugar amidotransferase